MWTPWQWAVAFPIVVAAMVGLNALMLWGAAADVAWAVIGAGGEIGGLFAAIGWTLRPSLAPFAALCLAAALTALGGAEAAMAGAGWPALALALVVAASWVGPYHYALIGAHWRSIAREAELFGASDATRRALIIHHPSPRGFQTMLQRAFTEALAERGWRVTLTTARLGADADVDAHDLLVLGAPAYNFRPASALVQSVRGMGSLADRNVVLVISGGGMTESALRFLAALLRRKGARIVSSIEVWTSRPNAERHGISDPQEIMRRAAQEAAERCCARREK